MSGKYSRRLLHHTAKSATDTIKTASKKAIQKTGEATGNLIRIKIADKIRYPDKSLEMFTTNHFRSSWK